MKKALLSLGIMAALTPTVASAEGGYLGGSYGRTEFNVSSSERADLNSLGFSVKDDSDQGFKVFGGYRFNKNIAVEGYYADLGDLELTGGSVNVDAAIDGYGVSLVGLLPVTEQVDLFAKVGMFHWSNDVSSNVGVSGGDDGTDGSYGLGVAYTMDSVTFRAEFERYDLGDVDVDLISAGLALNF
ncbi:porin family protein [Amphritea sp. 1_MG-2023]|uniref:porin family protein n=1 Tax=Amphritea sp. 1_MG-2023 TaxID=3062670 RepID=UPI0026E402E1|nr:porin family protein [Amphritea sp. 1_MG-2023]MDO6561816.1 porin family protein [Amphritea sp. 1_MG-2023]